MTDLKVLWEGNKRISLILSNERVELFSQKQLIKDKNETIIFRSFTVILCEDTSSAIHFQCLMVYAKWFSSPTSRAARTTESKSTCGQYQRSACNEGSGFVMF